MFKTGDTLQDVSIVPEDTIIVKLIFSVPNKVDSEVLYAPIELVMDAEEFKRMIEEQEKNDSEDEDCDDEEDYYPSTPQHYGGKGYYPYDPYDPMSASTLQLTIVLLLASMVL